MSVSSSFAMAVITVPKNMARITWNRGRICSQMACNDVPERMALRMAFVLMQQAE